jgi:hypothetical protein
MEEITKNKQSLEEAFSGLRQIFENAERDFKIKNEKLLGAIRDIQAQDAAALSKIQHALNEIIASNNCVKQNQEKK